MAITRNNPQTYNDLNNLSAYTFADYTVPSGVNQALVAVVLVQKNTTSVLAPVTVTYGGASLSVAVNDHAASGGNRYHYAGIFYLLEPAAGTAAFVVTPASSATSCILHAVTLTGVAPTAPIGATDTDRTPQAASLVLSNCVDDSLIIAATLTDSANTPSWSWTTATEAFDVNAGGNIATDGAGSGGFCEVTGDGTVTLTATRSAGAAAQYAVAAEFRAHVASGPAIAVLARHQRVLMTA